MREREPDLAGHLNHVASLARRMGDALGIEGEELDELVRAAELHDIGKMGIPDVVLHKPGMHDSGERDWIHRHTLIGERILNSAPAMGPVARLVRSSHERWDGRGYPDGLAGEDIPLRSRVIFICDAFDAMRSERPYSKAMSEAEARDELRAHGGTQFDPYLVELFLRLQDQSDVAAEADQAEAAPVPDRQRQRQ
jgi:HD-GYP domain-containing protein (c-di-GMP phosphodiesterase class II)